MKNAIIKLLNDNFKQINVSINKISILYCRKKMHREKVKINQNQQTRYHKIPIKCWNHILKIQNRSESESKTIQTLIQYSFQETSYIEMKKHLLLKNNGNRRTGYPERQIDFSWLSVVPDTKSLGKVFHHQKIIKVFCYLPVVFLKEFAIRARYTQRYSENIQNYSIS